MKKIKNESIIRHIPVILYSASYGVEQLSYNAAGDAYLAKPFDVDELINFVFALSA